MRRRKGEAIGKTDFPIVSTPYSLLFHRECVGLNQCFIYPRNQPNFCGFDTCSNRGRLYRPPPQCFRLAKSRRLSKSPSKTQKVMHLLVSVFHPDSNPWSHSQKIKRSEHSHTHPSTLLIYNTKRRRISLSQPFLINLTYTLPLLSLKFPPLS